jgi:hypothetical protein
MDTPPIAGIRAASAGFAASLRSHSLFEAKITGASARCMDAASNASEELAVCPQSVNAANRQAVARFETVRNSISLLSDSR